MKKSPTKKKTGRLQLWLICPVMLLTIVIASLACGLYLLSPVDRGDAARRERFEIPSGTSIHAVANRLQDEGMIRSASIFYLAARYPFLTGRKQAFVLKSGVYEVSSSYSISDLLNLLESAHQAYIHTVIPEGLTASKIAALLESDGVCSAESFIAATASKQLLAAYNIPAKNLEGYLFPDTYYFTPNMQAEDVVHMMLKNCFSHIAGIAGLQGKNPEEIHRVFILASIVEREYRLASEAPLIASVFSNRIAANIGLYSCATIEYIITELQGKPHPDVITYDDLQINSPYNTYKWAGLTPGPISNPGMVALTAAAEPPATDYYFFRLTDSVNGSHTFSKSFSAHTEAAVYQTKKAASR